MTEKEKQIQKALGLFKIYEGYVQAQGSTHFDVYEVQDVNMEGARNQLNIIIEHAQKKSKILLELKFIMAVKEKLPKETWKRDIWLNSL